MTDLRVAPPPPARIAPPPPTAGVPPLELLRAGQRVPVAWGYSTVLPDMDFEGFSAAGFEWDEVSQKFKAPLGATKKGLPSIGAAKYAEDPTTEVLCLAYDLKNGTGRHMWLPGMQACRVVHNKQERFDVYIGRPGPWGNPFEIGKDGDRDEVIAKYRSWVVAQPELMAQVRQLRGKTLGCWCSPKPCHGDVLSELAALPWDLLDHLAQFDPAAPPSYAQSGLVETHNSMFEFRIWCKVLHERWGWPAINLRQMRCSMAKARAFSLPGALGNLAEVLRVPIGKDKDGKKQLERFSWPRNPTKTDKRTRITCAEDPDNAAKLYSYCDQDIVAEAGASVRMPDLIPQELDYWLADQACNWRGVGVDLTSVHACIAVLQQAHEKYNAELYKITNGFVARASEISKLQEWVSDRTGYRMSSGDTEAVEETIKWLTKKINDSGNDGGAIADYAPVIRAMEIRNLIGSAAVKKVYAMARMATRGNRLCDLFIYHGARTGRDTHADVQPGNLPKSGVKIRWCTDVACGRSYALANSACPWCGASEAFSDVREKGVWDASAADDVLEIMRHRNLELVEYFYGDAVLAISGCVRSLLEAAEGYDLICSDYSAIEAVVLAMLSGEQWRQEAFARNESIYYHGAAGVTGKSYQFYVDYKKEHGQEHPDRNKIGKVCLGPETQVLTDRGYLTIVDVLLTDKVWDGVEWVNHSGLLDQGTKETMLLDGVRITPDHLVNTKNSWKEARLLGSSRNTLTLALETGSANLPWSGKLSGEEPTESSQYNAPVAHRLTKSLKLICSRALRRVVTNAPKLLRQLTEKCTTATPTQCRTMSTDVVCSTGFPRPLPGAIPLSKNSSIATVLAVSESAKSGSLIKVLFSATSRILKGGTIRPSTWTGKTATETTSLEISDLSRGERIRSTNEKSTNSTSKSNCSEPQLPSLSRVYDLANAGPRHRFTIRTHSGHLIVHNCELSLGYLGWVGAWRKFDSSDNFTDDEVKELINKWRAASPMIVECGGGQTRGKPWRPDRFENYGYEGMFLNAILYPGQVFEYRGIKFNVQDDILFITLLSGRKLTYHSPRAERQERFQGVETYALSYMTWNSNPAFGAIGWVRMDTYAGKILENITSATARDIMAHAVVNLEKANYPVVLRVHDEIASEVRKGFGSEQEFESIMANLPWWAKGWPVRCGGTWRGRRYRK